jgi:hypothetical protein
MGKTQKSHGRLLFRREARRGGFRMQLANGLPATVYRLDNPVIAEIRRICVNTGMWDRIYDPYKRQYAVAVGVDGVILWLILFRLDQHVAFQQVYRGTEKAVRDLAGNLGGIDKHIEKVVYKGRAYRPVWPHGLDLFLRAVAYKTPPEVTAVLTLGLPDSWKLGLRDPHRGGN